MCFRVKDKMKYRNNLQCRYKPADHINISLGIDSHQQLSFEIYHLLYAAFAVCITLSQPKHIYSEKVA